VGQAGKEIIEKRKAIPTGSKEKMQESIDARALDKGGKMSEKSRRERLPEPNPLHGTLGKGEQRAVAGGPPTSLRLNPSIERRAGEFVETANTLAGPINLDKIILRGGRAIGRRQPLKHKKVEKQFHFRG